MYITFGIMKVKKLLKIVSPYCSSIRDNTKHYVCYPINGTEVVVIARSSSDANYYKQVYRHFRKAGVIVKELEKYMHG